MTRATLAALVLLALAAPPAHAVSFQDGTDVHVESVKQLDSRLYALTLTTPLLTAPTNVRILLPADYDAQPTRRFPVLWLWHGTSGGAQDWTTSGAAEQTTAGRELIVVMPDAGVDSNGGSWFTDWVNAGNYGPPMWETWHIDRLIPWVDANLRTIATRAGRAIAGLSQGGFGTMSYAARHPDMFAAAASFSGAVDIAADPDAAALARPIINATEAGLDGVAPNTFFGDPATNEINWAAHDPATLAGNLRGMDLSAYTGDGNPGPLDPPGGNPGGQVIEAGVHQLNVDFHAQLLARDIPIDYHDYGPGTHSWPYWTRDLQQWIGPLMRVFDRRAPQPSHVDYMTDLAHYAEWGFDVTFTRPATEFSTLSDAGADRFALTGSGSAVVITPPFYASHAPATVTLAGPNAGDTQTLQTDAAGRLTVTVPLGPGNPMQEDMLGAVTQRFTTKVAVDAPLRRLSTHRRARQRRHAR